MGYFPNGTAARAYHAKYCVNCVHDIAQNCQVWLAHLATDYCDANGETSTAGRVLDLLIPPSEDGLDCMGCTMFMERGKNGLQSDHA